MKSNRQPAQQSQQAFYDLEQLGERWHCHKMTAYRRLLKLGIKPKKPSERAILYPVEIIQRIEALW